MMTKEQRKNMQGKKTLARMQLRKLWQSVFKYKLVVIVLLIIFVGLGGWQHQKSVTNNNWTKATDYYRHADYDNAAKILNKMSAPKDAARLSIYAQTMLATRQLDKAASAYQQLYVLNKDPFAKIVLGNIYNQQSKFDEATKIYQELITSNPTYAQAYVNLATLYKLQNKNDLAIATAEKAVLNNPNNTVLNELYVSMTMSEKDSPKFKTAVAKLEKLNPKDPLLTLVQ